MAIDTRTAEERKVGYPPSAATMVRRCTVSICGAPNEYLFDEVHRELIAYLNRPGLTVDDLFNDFIDATGSFSVPSVHDLGPGRLLKHFGLYRDRKAARRLVEAHPGDWADIIRVKGVGPDTFYDLFRMTMVRWIRAQGEALAVIGWGNGAPVDGLYFAITDTAVGAVPRYVRVRNGLPFDVDTAALYILPALGTYELRSAYPSVAFADERITYHANELTTGTSVAQLRATSARVVVRVGVSARMLRLFYDAGISRLAISATKASYPRVGKDGGYRDASGAPCTSGTCDEYAYIDQADLEAMPVRTLTVDPDGGLVTIPDLPAGTYTVSAFGEDAGITVTTARDVVIAPDQVLEAGIDHTFDLTRLEQAPPRAAFLQGDIVRQWQGSTRWCGPFSLAHAFSYWAPQAFNPTVRNGTWMGENVHDGWQTWAHILVGILTLGIAPAVFSIFEDDPSPGTLQETLVRGCRLFGFSGQPYAYDGISRDEALGHLKRWIAAGVPVLVAVDELMDSGEGHWSSEHFKVAIGYDDDARLRFVDDNGVEQENVGAFYFINSGGMGEDRDHPDDISAGFRETHADYDAVPIGNDTDAYEVFWKKWEAGSIPTFSKNFWCLPIYPVVWDKIPRE